MGIFNRTLLFLYALFFGLVCVGVICLCAHVVPDRVLLNEYEYLINQWQTIAVAAVIFLISIHLIFCAFDRGKSREISAKEVLVTQGNKGEVNISLNALREMAEGMAANVRGVRGAKVKAVVEHRKEQGDFLKMDVRLEVGQERNINAISDDVREQVGDYLMQTAGIPNVELAVSIQGIVSGVAVKKRRIK